MYYGWEPLRDVARPESLTYAEYIFSYSGESTDTALTDSALSRIRRSKPDYVFLYLVDTDEKGGHDRNHGTDSQEDTTIPMFYIGKQFEAGKRFCGGSIMDIAPTIANIIDVRPAAEWEGKAVI